VRRRALVALLAVIGVVLVVISDPRSSASYCGGRAEVRTLSDRDQSKVKLTPVLTGIDRLRAVRRPHLVELDGRRGPVETTTFKIRARLVAMRRRPAKGIAVVVSRTSARRETMIVGFEHPCGGWQTRKETTLMKQARSAFVRACGMPARRPTRLTGTAEISGVGFFGARGRSDEALNGIELHPVLGFKSSDCRLR
jgi:hypothetical protein